MAKSFQNGRRKTASPVADKAKGMRRSHVMRPEYLAEIERFRLMDDDFMSNT